MNVGVKEHNQYKLVDVNHRRRFKKYEPFILAMQATQVCYMSYPSTKRDKDDWLAVLKVKPRDVIESPDEGGIKVVESNLPFQVEEVEVHEIDMNIIVDEDIPLHDPNGETIEMAEPINEDLLLDHHELQEEITEDEGETEEEDDEEFEDEIDTDYRIWRSDVADQLALLSLNDDVTRGRGRGNTTRASKTSIRGRGSTSRVYMPTSNGIGEGASTQRNVIGEEPTSSQNNTIGEGESNNNSGHLEPSNICSTRICESFKSELDPNGINWKSVSQEIRDFYLGEFEKEFYWDPSIDSEVKILWRKKAARRYSDFISCIKKGAVRPKYVLEETWETWMRFWKDPKVVEKSKINSKNRCGGQNAVAKGTHTGGSITIGEHRKRLAIEKGRDPTPSELHLHVHTHGHDGKSFVGERARVVHEKYLEILQNQTQTQSNVDQLQAYYQAAGGEKKRRIYGLGSQAKSFYGKNFCAPASGFDVSSSIPCMNAQTTTPENLDDFMTRLIPSLTDHMLPVFVERVRELISSTSSQSNTPMTPVIPTPSNIDEANASVSNEDCGSPISLS
ncbi:hypothetical protein KY289_026391 [Solanum tuberosum]|nr:hypothetical protein KY289_026391 [Solanum tuberosum]